MEALSAPTPPLASDPNAREEYAQVIRPAGGWASINLKELWGYRELLIQLASRDIRARYKQSVLGTLWVVVQPLILMTIYYTIFGVVLRLKSGGQVNFTVFLLGGILIWQLISSAASTISTGLVANAHLMQKVYFPRLLIPIAQSTAALVDFGFGLLILALFMVLTQTVPSPLIVLAPAFVLLAMLAGMTLGLWFAPLNAKYRDATQVVPLLLQILLYLSPVFYPPTFVPEAWRTLYYLNPMAGIIQGFRWTLMADAPPDPAAVLGVAVMLLLFIAGVFVFRKSEAELADAL